MIVQRLPAVGKLSREKSDQVLVDPDQLLPYRGIAIAVEPFEQVLGIPKTVTLAAIVPVGYPVGKFGPVKRPPAEAVVSWDRYRS